MLSQSELKKKEKSKSTSGRREGDGQKLGRRIKCVAVRVLLWCTQRYYHESPQSRVKGGFTFFSVLLGSREKKEDYYKIWIKRRLWNYCTIFVTLSLCQLVFSDRFSDLSLCTAEILVYIQELLFRCCLLWSVCVIVVCRKIHLYHQS